MMHVGDVYVIAADGDVVVVLGCDGVDAIVGYFARGATIRGAGVRTGSVDGFEAVATRVGRMAMDDVADA